VWGAVESASTAVTESHREIVTVDGTNLLTGCSWIVVVRPLMPAQDGAGLDDGRCDGDGEWVGDGRCVVETGDGVAVGEDERRPP
jgi:hypothetical protein